ncbi:hypothetical protein [Sphingomonas montana]|uniref:hypothetical protein n=1 Tax=Sphingomonas montana TaxID=1843236 RepID=UPI001F0B6E41|nr:hypothetical protein [Sphingomonas montana]
MTAPRLTTPGFALGSAETGKASVRAAIAHAAERTGVAFDYLLQQAKTESGLNPNAQAGTSSAAGLYQFIDQSWLGVLKTHGTEHGYGWAANAIQRSGGRWTVDPAARAQVFALRKDPQAAALMAGEFASDNAAGLSKVLGRVPGKADLYFAHFLGLQGASRFLKAADSYPDASAASVFPREAGANRGIFYRKSGEPRSLAQVYQLMARKIEGAGGGGGGPGIGDGTPDNPVRMATYAPGAGVGIGAGETVTAMRRVDVPASTAAGRQVPAMSGAETMLALGGQAAQQRMNMMRPDPKFAMLAYMLVSTTPLDGDGDGERGGGFV